MQTLLPSAPPLKTLDDDVMLVVRLQKLDLIATLIDRLNAEPIRYCQWKSNHVLLEALAGQGDLDLLVHRNDRDRFHLTIAKLGFKQADDVTRTHIPSVCHYFGHDRSSGRLVHLHVYYRLMTGESLLKNYHIPLEEMLLSNTRQVQNLIIPTRAAELLLFIIRMMIKRASITETLLFKKLNPSSTAELQWLLAGDSLREAEALVAHWLPAVSPDLIRQSVDALQGQCSPFHRYRLARQLRKSLAAFRRSTALQDAMTRIMVLFKGANRRRKGERGGKTPRSGGILVAFVGPDATGKSTLVADTTQWLGNVFRVHAAHLGKPPSTWLTLLPNFVGRCMRILSRRDPDAALTNSARVTGFIASVRAALLARDRRALAVKLHALAANGAIVVCDRYPSAQLGAMDGARLDPKEISGWRGWVARLENAWYRDVPPPDVLIKLSAPVDVVVQRNRDRQNMMKEAESESYIRWRHAGAVLPSFPGCHIVQLDTTMERSKLFETVRDELWKLI